MSKKKKNVVFDDILHSLSKYFTAAVIIMIVVICFSGVRFIKSGNVALILRFGQLQGDTYEEQVHEPGLLLAFPYVIDEVVIVPTGSVIQQKVDTHFNQGSMSGLISSGYVITGDQNIVTLSATVKYKITDPVAYTLFINNKEEIINAIVSNSMVESAANMSADDILTAGKDEFTENTLLVAQREFDSVNMGITITNLELTKVSMPAKVVDVYNAVNAAAVKSSTLLEEAQNYKDTKIPSAQSEADKLISDAKSRYSQSLSEANQSLAEFWGIEHEFDTNKSVVKTRIFNKKMSEIISKIGTVKIVSDGESKIIIN